MTDSKTEDKPAGVTVDEVADVMWEGGYAEVFHLCDWCKGTGVLGQGGKNKCPGCNGEGYTC